jgi:hypothetical protein
MRPADGADPFAIPPGDRARVVFEYPPSTDQTSACCGKTYGSKADVGPVHVVDERGELLGDLGPHRWFAAELDPGEHVFTTWHDRWLGQHEVTVLRATLRAGALYVVELRREPRSSIWHYGKPHLRNASPPLAGSFDWSAFSTDPAAAHRWSTDERAVIEERLAEGRAKMDLGEFDVLDAAAGYASSDGLFRVPGLRRERAAANPVDQGPLREAPPSSL